ncbi:MAG: hypothetical protein R3C39_02640 [Dehalococcoidia bacterium]
MIRLRSIVLVLGLVAVAVAGGACADEDQTANDPGPYTAEDVLGVLEQRGLSYSMAGSETECWNHTPAGPVRYEGSQASLALWVYESSAGAAQVWDSNGPVPGSVNDDGLERYLGCFDGEMWVARRENIVVALDPRDEGSVATGVIVGDALASLPEPDAR